MSNPVEYAENTLGVHTVFAEAEARLLNYKAASDLILDLNGDIRSTKDNLVSREGVIIAEQGATTAGMTKVAAKEYLKEILDDDPEMGRLHDKLANLESERHVADADLRHEGLAVKMLTARMEELGGLLIFYAAAKRNASTTTSPQVD